MTRQRHSAISTAWTEACRLLTMGSGASMQPRGVLLLNLGTPRAPTAAALRSYLREFLCDPRVIDMPAIVRGLLVNLLIVPLRAPRSAAAYRQIWTDQGSPLLRHSESLRAALAAVLGDPYVVALGMRYGEPSIGAALHGLLSAGVDRLAVLPLFPQYASATTGSALARLLQMLQRSWCIPSLSVVSSYYDHPAYIRALAAVIAERLTRFGADALLLSFHGLPERHVARAEGPAVACDRRGPCPPIESRVGDGAGNATCYRAQCFATARALTAALGLGDDEVAVGFQSRLGRSQWLQPYTDTMVLPRLAAKGVKRLAVACPSFATDCLETLEEMGIRGRDKWLSLGGEAYELLPALNSHPVWVSAVAELVR